MKKKLFIATVLCTILALATCAFGERREAKQTHLFENEAAQIQRETVVSSSKEESTSSTIESSTQETSSSKEKVEVDNYTIQEGDTFSRILMVSNCSQDELKEINGWTKLPNLIAGKQIKVPKAAVKKLNQTQKSKEKESSTIEETVSTTNTYVDTTVTAPTEQTTIQNQTAVSQVIQEVPVQQSVSQAVQPVQQPVQQTPIVSAPIQ